MLSQHSPRPEKAEPLAPAPGGVVFLTSNPDWVIFSLPHPLTPDQATLSFLPQVNNPP